MMNKQFDSMPSGVKEQKKPINPHLAGFERFPSNQRKRIADLLALYREKWDLQNIPIGNVVSGLQELVGTIGETDWSSSIDEVIAALREEV